MANGLDIVRRTLERLKKPDDLALPYRTVLRTVGERIAQKRLDLTLSEQNHLMSVSPWFTPRAADSELSAIRAELSDILLPVRVEALPIDSVEETGEELPIVGYQALADSPGAVSFYGSPLRMVFRDSLDSVLTQKFRISYESDFFWESDTQAQLENQINLPNFFNGLIALESAFDLLEQVDDNTPEWLAFAARVNEKWVMQIAVENKRWEKYVKIVKGKVTVPKRTFFQNEARRMGHKTRFFKGDY